MAKITKDDYICILSGASMPPCSYWCTDWNYDKEEYKKAKETLESKGNKNLCFEDIVFHILENGGTIKLYDEEEETTHNLTYEKLEKGITEYLKSGYASSQSIEDWDGVDYDSAIQFAIFNDIIYG